MRLFAAYSLLIVCFVSTSLNVFGIDVEETAFSEDEIDSLKNQGDKLIAVAFYSLFILTVIFLSSQGILQNNFKSKRGLQVYERDVC